ncbi:WhiB family transcriptional regulator [Rhodococcoides trifolii]|nr:WhiB family transcriptional regulator [Rhodococcus trifolii]
MTTNSPAFDQAEWRLGAACRGMDADVFYPPENERGHARSILVAKARKICEQCPVLTECRAYALAVDERHGVWGGLSETDRRKRRTYVTPTSD